MNTYSDAYLDHYADRFVAMRLARRGVTLDQYLAGPAWYEPLALEHEPLLAAQAAVAARVMEADAKSIQIERSVEHLPRADNGAPFEELHHHRFPRAARLAELTHTRRAKL